MTPSPKTQPEKDPVSRATPEAATAAASRRRYAPPRLECHGRLAEVTRMGGSAMVDTGGGLGPLN